MRKQITWLLFLAMVAFGTYALPAQTPDQIIRQVVAAEHAADQNDHSQWMYLERSRKAKEDIRQWVAATAHGSVRCPLERNGQQVAPPQQREAIDSFLHDPRAQKKQLAEANHDDRQIDDLLELLPTAFLWTQSGATATTTSLHFEPAPGFHPPTREARVFGAMAGDLIADNQQHRVVNMTGHLIHEVTFGGGILGKLKEGSSFSLAQEQVGPSLWQLTAIHVHLRGNALLFKSVSLEEDDERSRFEREPSAITLDEAAKAVMTRASAPDPTKSAALK